MRLPRRFAPRNDVCGGMLRSLLAMTCVGWIARHDGRGGEASDFAFSVKVSTFEGYTET